MVAPGYIIEGKYRVLRRIGEGSMGSVYEGENIRIGRQVAIKVIHSGMPKTPELLTRFEREAQAAARISSRHVCSVLDMGDLPEGNRYIVMEYLEGVSLDHRIEARGKLSVGDLAPIAYELLEGLSILHRASIVHRDLKPANVFLASNGGRGETVKILDFGISKLIPSAEDMGRITAAGSIMGTPLYMSPEQARGSQETDVRADIYSVGVILYHALAGRVPFTGENFHQLLFKVALQEPPPLEDFVPDVDPDFSRIVRQAMARNIEQRFASAQEFQAAIVDWGRSHRALTGELKEAGAEAMPEMVGPAVQNQPSLGPSLAGSSDWIRAIVEGRGTPTAWAEDSRISGYGLLEGTATGTLISARGAELKAPTRTRAPSVAAAVALLGVGGFCLYLGFLDWFGATVPSAVSSGSETVVLSPALESSPLPADPTPERAGGEAVVAEVAQDKPSVEPLAPPRPSDSLPVAPPPVNPTASTPVPVLTPPRHVPSSPPLRRAPPAASKVLVRQLLPAPNFPPLPTIPETHAEFGPQRPEPASEPSGARSQTPSGAQIQRKFRTSID